MGFSSPIGALTFSVLLSPYRSPRFPIPSHPFPSPHPKIELSPRRMWHRSHNASSSITGKKKLETAALAFIISILVASVWILSRSRGTITRPDRFHASSSVELKPSTAVKNGTDVIWQIHNSSSLRPKAVLFIAHGCNGRAGNFWDPSPACPTCVGLPEERLVVLHALRRGFAVLAISSAGRCWSLGNEINVAKEIIEWWTRESGLESLPLVALGASSGGYFVSALATKVRFSSVVLMIAEGLFHQMGVPDGYPPTLFVHMPKDIARDSMIRKNMEALRRRRVDVKEIRCMEFPLTPDFLSERIPGFDRSLSVKLLEMFRRHGFVDGKGLMKKDGRATPWKGATGIGDPSLQWAPHIQEELNLAYAYHEMTALQMEDILSWFESHWNHRLRRKRI